MEDQNHKADLGSSGGTAESLATDRQLLELAAKAAGIKVWWSESRSHPMVNDVAWNPLTDDGDALRLAVKLKFKIAHHAWRDEVTVFRTGDSLWTACEYANEDPYTATRRAIVRAAAAIASA